MLSRSETLGQSSDRVALKDDRLVYRACSVSFARCLGFRSPDDIIGKNDFDLFSGEIAREQMVLDSQIMHSGEPDISTLWLNHHEPERGPVQTVIVRTPVISADNQVRGIDIRLLGGSDESQRSPVDFQSLVEEGLQGSLIIDGRSVRYANDRAARILGYPSARALISSAEVPDIFDLQQLRQALSQALEQSEQANRIARAAAEPLETVPQKAEQQGTVSPSAGSPGAGQSAAEHSDAGQSGAGQSGAGQSGAVRSDSARSGQTEATHRQDWQQVRQAVPWNDASDDLPPPAQADQVQQRVNLLARSQTGSQLHLIARIAPTFWEDQRVMLISFIDVALSPQTDEPDRPASLPVKVLTRQLADLKRIRANEQRYRHYASAAADFFWELDARLAFRVASDGLLRVLGLPREHVIGRTLAQLLDHPSNISDMSLLAEQMELLRNSQPFRDFEFRWAMSGDASVVRLSGIPVFNPADEFVGYRGVGSDVTAAVRQAETLAYHASHDALTGLVNRRSFEATATQALESARQSRNAHALCFLDLDAFKIVNDTCGHQAGDELLRQLTQLFDSLVRKSDVLARLGGDEFAILLYRCSVAEALKLANQIRHEVENFQFLWKENRFNIGVSVGLVIVDDRWESVQSLFAAADSACYIAKNEGRNRVVVYREGEGNSSNRKVSTHWVEEINTALEADRLRLASQSILPLGSDQPEGLRKEMLLRLELPTGELVAPRAFLPAAERYGLIATLDERAIELTLSWLAANPLMLDQIRHVSMNLSAATINDVGFATRLLDSISNSPVPASKLCFEISETAVIANLASVSAFMGELSAVGCRFGIDDFGSGLSSFAYLRKLPVDFLKIDGLLIRDILQDQTDFTLVKAICDISKSMGKRTVAESIESSQLLEAATGMGIDFGQGFHLDKPELIS